MASDDTQGEQLDRSSFQVQYFIQTRREIDTEKQERSNLFNYAVIPAGATISLIVAQTQKATGFLSSPSACYLYGGLLFLTYGIVAARRAKLQQIYDRWLTLYCILLKTKNTDWALLEPTVFDGFEGRRYLWEDWLLHFGLSALVYALALMTMASAGKHWLCWVVLAIVVHLVITTCLLLRRFEVPKRFKKVPEDSSGKAGAPSHAA